MCPPPPRGSIFGRNQEPIIFQFVFTEFNRLPFHSHFPDECPSARRDAVATGLDATDPCEGLRISDLREGNLRLEPQRNQQSPSFVLVTRSKYFSVAVKVPFIPLSISMSISGEYQQHPPTDCLFVPHKRFEHPPIVTQQLRGRLSLKLRFLSLCKQSCGSSSSRVTVPLSLRRTKTLGEA